MRLTQKDVRKVIPQKAGGERGIRTLDTVLSCIHDFQSGAFNRSATSPCILISKPIWRAKSILLTKKDARINANRRQTDVPPPLTLRLAPVMINEQLIIGHMHMNRRPLQQFSLQNQSRQRINHILLNHPL